MGTNRGLKAVAGGKAVVQGDEAARAARAGKGRTAPVDEPMDAAERLVKELARVRARFAVDPADARDLLAEAWMSPTAPREEDEAEFVDAVADCLGAGLPLEAALSCWDSGELAYEQDGDDDEAAPTVIAAAAHHSLSARRLLVR